MYVKKALDENTIDMMRINLSARERKLSAEPVCDFCGDPKPTWVYAAERMETGEMCDCWRWCACDSCSFAIDSDDWTALEQTLRHRLGQLFPSRNSKMALSIVRLALNEFKTYAKKG